MMKLNFLRALSPNSNFYKTADLFTIEVGHESKAILKFEFLSGSFFFVTKFQFDPDVIWKNLSKASEVRRC